MQNKCIIRTEDEWLNLLDSLNESGITYVASADLDEHGAPASYPVMVKSAMTTVHNQDDEEMPAYLLILVTKLDAVELLNVSMDSRSLDELVPELKDYQYAEAL